MKKHIFGLGILAGACLMILACNSGDGVTAVSSTELVGHWNFTRAEFHYTSKTTPAVAGVPDYKKDTVMDVTGKGNYIEFKNNMTYVANLPTISLGFAKAVAAKVDSGTWSINGNTLTTISVAKDTVIAAVSISGASGTFTASLNDSSTDAGETTTTSFSSVFVGTKQ